EAGRQRQELGGSRRSVTRRRAKREDAGRDGCGRRMPGAPQRPRQSHARRRRALERPAVRPGLPAALAGVALLAGCGGAGGGGKATVWVTRDEGRHVVLTGTVPAGLTAMQA